MNWPTPIDSSLPPPDDNEPSSLREDLVDEITDHLLCAMDRESQQNHDPDACRAEVVRRFGDPARVVRQLWFHAMWGAIMSKRLTFITAVASTVTAMATLVLAWVLIGQLRDTSSAVMDATSSMHELTKQLLAQNATQNAAFVDQLQKMQSSSIASSSEWTRLRFRLVRNDAQKSPAVGLEVEIGGKLLSDGDETKLMETTNAMGEVDFGLVRPGSYRYRVFRNSENWRDYSSPQLHLNVRVGSDHEEVVVCPDETMGGVQFTMDWPEGLDASRYVVVAPLRWEDGGRDEPWVRRYMFALVDGQGISRLIHGRFVQRDSQQRPDFPSGVSIIHLDLSHDAMPFAVGRLQCGPGIIIRRPDLGDARTDYESPIFNDTSKPATTDPFDSSGWGAAQTSIVSGQVAQIHVTVECTDHHRYAMTAYDTFVADKPELSLRERVIIELLFAGDLDQNGNLEMKELLSTRLSNWHGRLFSSDANSQSVQEVLDKLRANMPVESR